MADINNSLGFTGTIVNPLQDLQSVLTVGNLATDLNILLESGIDHMSLQANGLYFDAGIAGGSASYEPAQWSIEGFDGQLIANISNIGCPNLSFTTPNGNLEISTTQITTSYSIEYPDVPLGDYTMPLSVNNIFADVNGNIDLSSIEAQTLQDVIDLGNTATDVPIIFENSSNSNTTYINDNGVTVITDTGEASVSASGINISDLTSGNATGLAPGVLTFINGAGPYGVQLSSSNVLEDYTLFVPNSIGGIQRTIPLSVNGIFADDDGSIIVPDSTSYIPIESQVKILASCPTNDFQKAHGTIRVGGAMYLGTRANGVDAPVLICYPDKDDLSVNTKIEMPLAGAGVNSIENICYDEVNHKLYATLSSTTKILEVNPDDITDYTIHTIALSGGATFAGSSSCLTDGTHIYVGAESTTGRFIKIAISDFTEVANVVWTGRSGAHAGAIDTVSGYAYFTNNGASCYLAKVDLSDLSYTEVNTGLSGLTDDFAFCDGESNQTFTNYVICGGEATVPESLNGACIDVDSMVVYPMSILPTVGLFYDKIENKVYSTGIAGFIERWDFSSINLNVINDVEGKDSREISDVFTMRGFMPNEMILYTDDTFVNPTEIFVTIWEDYNIVQTGKLKKITLDKVINTSITKYEIIKRFM